MAQVLRQSTQVVVVIGPFVDVTDGFTPETGITLGAADEAEILKANTTTTTDISGATWAAITGCDGWYGLTLTTSHTDTVGALTVMVNDDSVCLPVFARFQVIEEAAYDTIYAASASPASTTNITAGTITTATNVTTVNGLAANVITATSIAADAITAAKVAADVTTELQSGLATAASLATTDGKVDSILADTGTDGVVVAAGSKTGYSLTATTGLGNQTADITGNLSGSVGSVTGAVGSVTGAVGSVTGNVGGNVVGSVASVTAGVTLAASAVQAIWDALTTALTTVGSIGKKLADWIIGTAQTGDSFARLGAPAGASVSADIAAVKVDTAAILVDTGTTLDGKIDTVDTVVDAIKAKTDSLTFTLAGHVDANVQRINDVAITGDGSAGDKFDVV